MKQHDKNTISKLLEIMERLRDPQTGCPWDRAQSFASIAPYTIEEAYEVADAIEREAADELLHELGDLLFQVVFHARLAEEAGLFGFGDVVNAIADKLIRRHPHVFDGEAPPADPHADWEAFKQAERAVLGHTEVLAGIPSALPALTRAVKLGRRAARVGFDWPQTRGVRAKLDEELRELDAACADGDPRAVEAELGDLLFTLGNLCRHLQVDPEQALRGSNRRFELRFAGVESRVADARRGWREHTPEELDQYWEAAKAEQRKLPDSDST